MPQFYKRATVYKDISGKATKIKTYPTLQLTQGDSRIAAQNGELWYLEGKLIPRDKWPKWAIEQLDKADESYLESAGFDFWWRKKKEVKVEVTPSPRSKKVKVNKWKAKPIKEVEDGNTSTVELVS